MTKQQPFNQQHQQKPLRQNAGKQKARKHWFVLAYDVREQKRLRRLHYYLKKRALPLQRSVFLLHKKPPEPLRTLNALYAVDLTANNAFSLALVDTTNKLSAAKDISSLMGLEGQVAQSWFVLLAKSLPFKWKFAGRTPWSVTVNRDQLQRDLLHYVLECREAILAGRYQPEPLRQFPMKKPDGNIRVISAQHLKDKLIQRALLIVLEPKAEAMFHHDSYAYRRGRNVDMALDKARERIRIGQDWLVDADITKFFDNIPLKPLQKKLKPFVRDAETMGLIGKWLKQGAHQVSFIGNDRGISQGSILSPLFCNLYMHEFDQAMSKANIPFVRFADDFLLFLASEKQAIKACDYAKLQLERLGLELHSQKTRVVRSSPDLVFLGQQLPEPGTEQKKRFFKPFKRKQKSCQKR